MFLIKLVFSMIWLMAKYQDLARRTQPDKVLRDKAFETARNPEYDGYQRALASMVFKFFDEKSNGNGIKSNVKSTII